MKLFFSPTSPYVRTVLVIAHELGLASRIELSESEAHPLHPDERITPYNPTGKIPTMILRDGTALYDSRVIAAYLDSIHSRSCMYPESSAARFRVLTIEALAHGLMDAALVIRTETTIRPEPLRWSEWLNSQVTKIDFSLNEVERQLTVRKAELNAGWIAVGCALGYLDFRFSDKNWRTLRPATAAWFAGFSQRPSMLVTAPTS